MLLISITMVLISGDGIGTICNAVYLFLYGIISAFDYFWSPKTALIVNDLVMFNFKSLPIF